MSPASITTITNGQCQLHGDVTRLTVPLLWKQITALSFVNENMLQISLEHTERFDSAGLVMLIHLLEHAKNQKCHIMLSFIPKQLQILIELYNLGSVIKKHI